MPDITMCLNHKCNRRLVCYRFIAEPQKHWQAYTTFEPAQDGKCRHFVAMDGVSKEVNNGEK